MRTNPRRDRHSIERYHRALDVLAEMTEQRADSDHARSSEHDPRVQPAQQGAAGVPAGPKRSEELGPLKSSDDSSGNERPPRFVDDALSSGTVEPLAPPSIPSMPEHSRTALTSDPSRRRRIALAAFGVALCGTLIGVAVSTSSSSPARHANQRAPFRVTNGASRSHSTTGNKKAISTAAPTTSTSTTAPLSTSKAPARLRSISPGTASPGQTVTLTGDGFESSNGLIVAMFGSEPVPTNCPTESRCVARVPVGTQRDVVVRVRTESGLSNGISFHYG